MHFVHPLRLLGVIARRLSWLKIKIRRSHKGMAYNFAAPISPTKLMKSSAALSFMLYRCQCMFVKVFYYNLFRKFGRNEFDRYICTVPTNNNELPYLLLFQSYQVETVAVVKVLDNLTTSKYLIGDFSSYIVWNDWMKNTLIEDFEINKQKITIAGAPQQIYFRKRKDSKTAVSKTKTRLSVCYLASAFSIYEFDPELINYLSGELTDVDFTVKTHPADTDKQRFKKLINRENVNFFSSAPKFRAEEFTNEIASDEYFDLLKRSDISISCGSTCIVDSICVGALPVSINLQRGLCNDAKSMKKSTIMSILSICKGF